MRCNYLELIYCKKRGTSDLLSPPFTSTKSQSKRMTPAKKQVQVWRTPTIWRGIFVFFTSYHRQATRKMCFMLNVCPPLRHCDDGNGGSMWQCFFLVTHSWMVNENFEKKRKSVSSSPPFPSIKKKHHILQVVSV